MIILDFVLALKMNVDKYIPIVLSIFVFFNQKAVSIKRQAFLIPPSFKSCVATPPFVPPEDEPIQLPRSCLEVKQKKPGSLSGIYSIAIGENTIDVYCNMETLCGTEGGWTRLAFLNMTDTTESCPSTLQLFEVDGVRACGRTSPSCSSVLYPSHGINYTQICGRARGYQFRSPDAVDFRQGTGHNDINSHYVDGLSLTRGSPRQHVWTYMAGLKEDNSFFNGRYTCPCQIGSLQTNDVPSFIGSDYYCESGNPAQPPSFQSILYTADPLWDGEQCNGLESPCCTPSALPWFHRVLEFPTNDDIEARLCGDQSIADEDSPIDLLEVYVMLDEIQINLKK